MSNNDSAHTPVVFCPDPSAHSHKDHKLQDAAAGSALYHHDDSSAGQKKINPLDENGRLSSAGAAASLKYAKAQDLPSFPIVGIDKGQSAGSAATLAHANRKSFEHWKPGKIDDSHTAAMLAKDYKMDPLWQPKASAAGSKAAMLAAAGPGRDWWQPSATKDGGSAAEIAMRTKGLSPQAYAGVGDQQKKNAMLAATQSVKGRNRAGSTPAAPGLYPDAHNAEQNAYSAAMEASRITHLNKKVDPQMFTEHPPIAYDAEDRKHDESLKASAIAMAKQMYAAQKVDDDGRISLDANEVAARSAHNRQSTSTTETDLKTQAMQYLTLQDAAQKLAAERLAKIQNPDETAAFRSYYGYPSNQPRSRMSVRGSRNLDRASSEGATARDPDSSDDERANRVRRRQSALNKQVAEVDQKRDNDRKNLLAAAERRVHAQMTEMDQKVYDRTGRMSQGMVEQWDAKARAKAAANSEARMVNHGKVDIGGGKWMDQSAIEAIAAARIKPTLDDISEKAARQREHDEKVRLDEEQRKQKLATEKERAAASKAEQKRTREIEKSEAKTKKGQEKQAAKNEKELEKQRVQEEKRRSKDAKALAATATSSKAVTQRPATTETTDITASTPTTEPITTYTTASTTTSAIPDEPPQIPPPNFRLGSVDHGAHEAIDEDDIKQSTVAPTVIKSEPEVPKATPEKFRVGSVDVGAHEAIDEDDLKQPVVLPSIAKMEKRQVKETLPPTIIPTTTAPAISASQEPTSPAAKRSSTGFKGLFGKLRRGSKDPSAPVTTTNTTTPSTLTKTAPTTTSTTTTTTTTTTTASSAPKISTSTEAPIPSTSDTSHLPSGNLLLPALVAKAETATSDVSDLSDSDDDLYVAPEQESRGRTRSRGTLSSTDYEEARDTLAPPPQPEFVSSKHGEKEGGSPSRGSKFHEEV